MNNLKGKNLCDPGGFMRHKKPYSNSVNKGIMELKKGVVWVGCPDKECKKNIAIKKCTEYEYNTQKEFHKLFPTMIPDVYEGVKCVHGFYMYSEYIDGGTLKKYKGPNLDKIVYKVLLNLKLIHDKYPHFRHNDLHVDNVLINDKQNPLIYDFELASWKGINPTFDKRLKEGYGIYPGNNPMYDFHFFVTSISADLPARFRKKALSVFPSDYLVANSDVVKEFRLRSDVIHTRLPTMNQVLKAFSVPNSKMRLLTFSGPNKKTKVTRSPLKSKNGGVKFSARNKERVSLLKIKLINDGMNNVEAELKAIKNIESRKKAGTLTPSPVKLRTSPIKMTTFFPKRNVPTGPLPIVTFGISPTRRPRINKKLCTSYKKDDLIKVMRRLGHRVDSKMTMAQICSKIKATAPPVKLSPKILVTKKKQYKDYLKKNVANLAKRIGIKVTTKNKKQQIINKLYTKLNTNTRKILKKSNMNKVTAKNVINKLVADYGWANKAEIERSKVLNVYKSLLKTGKK